MADIPVWEATVDDERFRCVVERLDDDYRGMLVVTGPQNESILRKEVGLSYGARFGPDVDDVNAWREWSLDAIDRWIATNG